MPAIPKKPSLRDRVLKAGGWAISGYLIANVMRLGGNLILTRLLVPEMFGLMAIVYVLIAGFTLFSDVGLTQNIIQSRRGEDPKFLDTAWIVQIIRGGLIWLLTLLLSVALHIFASLNWLPAGSVYADPQLPLVIAIYSSIQLVSGFQSTKVALARRNLALARLTQIDITAQVISLFVMVSWAFLNPSIWALVGGTILGSVVKLLLYHAWLPGPRNHWQWDPQAFREIIGFGKWVFLSSILGFLVNSGDRLLLGGLIDAHTLGLYSVAFMIVSFPQLALGQLTMRIGLPVLSEIARNNPEKLRATYYKFRLPFDCAMLFVSGFLFTFGAPLISFLYDYRYHGAGNILEILALGIIAARYQLAEQCYLALGKPRLLTPLYILRIIFLYALMPIAFWWNQFEGALWAIALTPYLSLPLVFYFKNKNQILDLKRELAVLPVILLGASSGIMLEFLIQKFE